MRTDNEIISINAISKKYYFKNSVSTQGQSATQPGYSPAHKEQKEFWALKNISLTIRKGEVWGIIGRNGSGKSTLLKILSGTTAPSSGKVSLWGNVMSILDVGSGLHPDLNGRENAYMYGTLLGLSNSFIKQNLKALEDFSELGDFIQQPVKTYSRGMYLRLAFSLAIIYRVDILLLDEVLAVGDASFMAKCNDQIDKIISQGTSILLASHSNSDILKVCDKCIWLDKGEIIAVGDADKVLSEYLLSVKQQVAYSAGDTDDLIHKRQWNNEEAPQNGFVRILSIELFNEGVATHENHLDYNRAIIVKIEYDKIDAANNLSAVLSVFDFSGNPVLITSNCLSSNGNNLLSGDGQTGKFSATCTIPPQLLNMGKYKLQLTMLKNNDDISLVTKNILNFYITSPHTEQVKLLNRMPMNIAASFKWNSTTLS